MGRAWTILASSPENKPWVNLRLLLKRAKPNWFDLGTANMRPNPELAD